MRVLISAVRVEKGERGVLLCVLVCASFFLKVCFVSESEIGMVPNLVAVTSQSLMPTSSHCTPIKMRELYMLLKVALPFC